MPGGALTVMTYNIHGGKGLDGKRDLQRIADVIAPYNPDVVALQEVDVERDRSDYLDQADEIAKLLEMEPLFYPAMQFEEGLYGLAVLSRLPTKLLKAELLPHVKPYETRAAMWVELELDETRVNLINTHLGLRASERREQFDALCGKEWLRHPDFKPPAVLVGDLNTHGLSPIYRKTRRDFSHICKMRPAPWRGGSFLGVLSLDHIFVTPEWRIEETFCCRGLRAFVASDHLPVLARLQLEDAAD